VLERITKGTKGKNAVKLAIVTADDKKIDFSGWNVDDYSSLYIFIFSI
jgi:hypothetical protein